MVKYFKSENTYLFLMIAAIYVIFSNGRITTSMDVDVLNYAKDFYETGSFGSDKALASGIVFSPHTEKFYPNGGVWSCFAIHTKLRFFQNIWYRFNLSCLYDKPDFGSTFGTLSFSYIKAINLQEKSFLFNSSLWISNSSFCSLKISTT